MGIGLDNAFPDAEAGGILTEEFNGTSWSIIPANIVSDGSAASGFSVTGPETVTCASSAYCLATANETKLPSSGPFVDETVLGSFDGNRWTAIANPDESPGNLGFFIPCLDRCPPGHQYVYSVGYDVESVSCPGGIYCVAVGQFNTSSNYGILMMTNKRVVSMAVSTSDGGYWEASANGGVFDNAGALHLGSVSNLPLQQPIVGIAATPDGKGYWEVAADGGVFAFGTASFFGSASGIVQGGSIVALSATPDGGGYWLASSNGGILCFGDAGFFGSLVQLSISSLKGPIVGMASTPDGKGYWLVGADGGVFTFGDATLYGTAVHAVLRDPIVGITSTLDGKGYWLVASDGGVFSFGDAVFYGSMGGIQLTEPVAGVAATADGNGYWLVASDGGIFTFGDAQFFGSDA